MKSTLRELFIVMNDSISFCSSYYIHIVRITSFVAFCNPFTQIDKDSSPDVLLMLLLFHDFRISQ